MKTLTCLLFISIFMASCTASADVYKCIENGVTKFSAYPCKDPDAQAEYDIKRSESMESYQARQQVKLQQQLDEQRRRAEQYIASYPSIPAKLKEAILDCKIIRGMTRKHVYYAWNILPERENRSVTRDASLTHYTYTRAPICANDKFKEADLTFDNRTKLLVGWNIRY